MSKVYLLWTNIKTLVLSSSIFSIGIFSYFYFIAEGNKKRWLTKLNDENDKHTTRPTNDYFGINWGFRADSMVNQSFSIY